MVVSNCYKPINNYDATRQTGEKLLLPIIIENVSANLSNESQLAIHNAIP